MLRLPRSASPTARSWHAVTALLIAVCLVAQLSLTLRGTAVLVDENGVPLSGLSTRLVRFFVYFTIESNLFSMVTAALLVLRPHIDGRAWRVARIAAVVGMTVTFVVYLVALAPILDLSGTAYWTDLGFHIAAPLLTLLGWLLFGPRLQFDPHSAGLFVIWPVAWIVVVLGYGAQTSWYPYPFLDVVAHGYGTVLLHCLLIAVLLLGVAALAVGTDRALPRAGADGSDSAH